MAERKKGKKRKEEYLPVEDIVEKPSKDEYKIAKWLRKNVLIKKTKFLNHNVEYFTAIRAVDKLMESPWANGDAALFKNREDIVNFLHIMLEHKFFHRARKVPISEHELKAKKKDKKQLTESSTSDEKSKNKEKEKETDSNEVKEKRKRKIRLDMHNDQRFVDGLDAYVWIYDPIPFYYWIFGTLMVLGAIGMCLFPLWPPSVRLGVYYLSVAAAGFLIFIILLAILRLILFCFVWMCTMGKHHIWILPNLTEDVGILPSFWPLYTYEYKGGNSKKKEKESDGEDDPERSEKQIAQEKGQENEGEVAGSESESESSQKSSTGKDFEIVDQEELYS